MSGSASIRWVVPFTFRVNTSAMRAPPQASSNQSMLFETRRELLCLGRFSPFDPAENNSDLAGRQSGTATSRTAAKGKFPPSEKKPARDQQRGTLDKNPVKFREGGKSR